MKLAVDIHCRFDGFSLSTRFQTQSRLVGLFGPSGAGKTTLLNALAGLVTPDSGEIALDDQVIFNSDRNTNVPPERRDVGVVFQEGRLFPHLTVLGNLKFAQRLTPRERRSVTIDQVVTALELEPLLKARVGTLSGGQCQRVALGRTLLTCPKLLLLDEPMASLDQNSKQRIIPLLRRVQQEFDIDMLVVSHSLSDLLLLTDQLLLLEKGKIVGQGTTSDLIRENRLVDLAGHVGVPNILYLKVSSHEHRGGLTQYRGGNHGDLVIKGSLRCDLARGTEVRAVLPPDEIALSWAPVEYISMQNQLRGQVKELVYGRHDVYCCVDVGQDLWVRVTPNAIKQLELQPGRKIWCLFKTFAFELLEAGCRPCWCGKPQVDRGVVCSPTTAYRLGSIG